MSESKDIRKLEIPENLKEMYRKEMKLTHPHASMEFWGSFISELINLLKKNRDTIEKLIDEKDRLEQELEIRTGEYKHNKVTEGIEALQNAGFSVELHFRERKNG